ncbi:hypothetical protein GUJ93_ZPchr0010g7917 [Zizania palustris]|uniref:Uncharacterized protein n=1 Tax=Zizania palustris TaxID=103762 RepID=A0A8J5WF17_ZIZPA|nr:hypothetical protein GUJ93_ZPchr0010g7917 [Zizania palustris]
MAFDVDAAADDPTFDSVAPITEDVAVATIVEANISEDIVTSSGESTIVADIITSSDATAKDLSTTTDASHKVSSFF